MSLRGCPWMLVNKPPTKILPSACIVIELTLIVRVRVETRVERAVRIQSGHVVARRARNAGKLAADENPAVGLRRDGIDFKVRVRVE